MAAADIVRSPVCGGRCVDLPGIARSWTLIYSYTIKAWCLERAAELYKQLQLVEADRSNEEQVGYVNN